MGAYRHLTLRVPWHTGGWSGRVCGDPAANSWCSTLPRILKARVASAEAPGEWFADLASGGLPPCTAERGAFMSSRAWSRVFVHPYKDIPKAAHGHLKPTRVDVPPYTDFATPFWWMLRGNQAAIEEQAPGQLPPDEKPPFPSPWVYGRDRQRALLELFFGRVSEGESLTFFYAKSGNPVDENAARMLVGVGLMTRLGRILKYEVDSGQAHFMWDRPFHHSIRPDGVEGFVLPYHQYLEADDSNASHDLGEIAVRVPPEHVRAFSYGTELADHDAAVVALVDLLRSVQAIRRHGRAEGPWSQREEWLDKQLARVWKARGAFPGLGAVLRGGLRLSCGAALAWDLQAQGTISPMQDPWPAVDGIIRGRSPAPRPEYRVALETQAPLWHTLSAERRALLSLLSRFDLTPEQARRMFDTEKRFEAGINVADEQLLENPYVMSELDCGGEGDGPISVQTLDLGLLPDDTVRVSSPVPSPSTVADPFDPRRVRALTTSLLATAERDGDTLLSELEVRGRLADARGLQAVDLPQEWFAAHEDFAKERFVRGEVQERATLQLRHLQRTERLLERILSSRAGKRVTSPVHEDWAAALGEVLAEGKVRRPADDDTSDHAARFREAFRDQVSALEQLVERRLTVLVGPAGTGKTTVLGALFRSEQVRQGGVLLLAPTGKARVKLGRQAGSEGSAFTIAQFLTQQGRFDWKRMQPKLDGGEQFRGARTVVVDECSMVTVVDLLALLQALDLAHVQRVILVGDPSQLPPIGPGRPFADLVAWLRPDAQDEERNPARWRARQALSELKVIVRQREGAEVSHTLQLASWFADRPQPPDADQIFDLLRTGKMNDLSIVQWSTPPELNARLFEAMDDELGLNGDKVEAMNRVLGLAPYKSGWSVDNPDRVESFQLLSPVRGPPWGTGELNRQVQARYRRSPREFDVVLGDERIRKHDKIIQIRNQRRGGYHHAEGAREWALANGEIGIYSYFKNGWANIAFAGRSGWSFGYRKKEFGESGAPVELAYAITVHKAQGSDFETVFLVLPRSGRLLSRELLYTALTRGRRKLVLLVEGDDPGWLFEYSHAGASVSARRNGNLLLSSVRDGPTEVPFAEHLIHRADDGTLLRSKSEVIIANMLVAEKVPYHYERLFVGEHVPGHRRPDFSFVDPAGDLILWEHLGMLDRESYRRSWARKKAFYEANGFHVGENLFTTVDKPGGGIDSRDIRKTVGKVKALLFLE